MNKSLFFSLAALFCAAILFVGCGTDDEEYMRIGSAYGLAKAAESGRTIAVKATFPDGTEKCATMVSIENIFVYGQGTHYRFRINMDGKTWAIVDGETYKGYAQALPDTTKVTIFATARTEEKFAPQITTTGVVFTFRVMGLKGTKASDDAAFCTAPAVPAATK